VVEEALKVIGIGLSTVAPSQKTFLITSTQHRLQEHGPQWINGEKCRVVAERNR